MPRLTSSPGLLCRRALVRSQILRATSAHSPLPSSYYKASSQYLSQAFADGTYLKDGPQKGDAGASTPPNPLTDPAAMDGMMAGMKTQMVMMVPQMVIMGWINFFFQGFVLSESVGLPSLHAVHRDSSSPLPRTSLCGNTISALSPTAADADPHTMLSTIHSTCRS